MMQLENGPRQALNRMMPGLGGMMPRLKLSPPTEQTHAWGFDKLCQQCPE
ncbi:MAG: hypothetical protein M5U34_04935 [Chloroflexi bacterium]|nr:hypothetical protein [Chloroflexota bacterium]